MDCEPVVEKEAILPPGEIGAGRPATPSAPALPAGSRPRRAAVAQRAGAAGRLPWHRGRPPGPEHLPRALPAAPEPIAAGRARQLSRAPRGLRQAGNLLLFVECFCHANPRARRWRWALRRCGVFTFFFFFFFSLLLSCCGTVLFPKKES